MNVIFDSISFKFVYFGIKNGINSISNEAIRKYKFEMKIQEYFLQVAKIDCNWHKHWQYWLLKMSKCQVLSIPLFLVQWRFHTTWIEFWLASCYSITWLVKHKFHWVSKHAPSWCWYNKFIIRTTWKIIFIWPPTWHTTNILRPYSETSFSRSLFSFLSQISYWLIKRHKLPQFLGICGFWQLFLLFCKSAVTGSTV